MGLFSKFHGESVPPCEPFNLCSPSGLVQPMPTTHTNPQTLPQATWISRAASHRWAARVWSTRWRPSGGLWTSASMSWRSAPFTCCPAGPRRCWRRCLLSWSHSSLSSQTRTGETRLTSHHLLGLNMLFFFASFSIMFPLHKWFVSSILDIYFSTVLLCFTFFFSFLFSLKTYQHFFNVFSSFSHHFLIFCNNFYSWALINETLPENSLPSYLRPLVFCWQNV